MPRKNSNQVAPKNARPGKLSALRPMLASLTDAVFANPDWVFEVKHDGYRAMAVVKNGKAEIYSRNGNSFNSKFPEIVDELSKLGFDGLLDGEIAILDEDGISRFQMMQNYIRNRKGTLVFYLFDILHFQGKSLAHLPLLERKQFLEKIIPESRLIRYSPHFENGPALFHEAEKLGLEGIIAKKKDSLYLPGKRTSSWLKIKTASVSEVIIGGFTKPSGARSSFGALLTGVMEGEQLVYRGKVGTGFKDADLKALYKKMIALKTEKPPFKSVPAKDKRNVTWIKPQLIAQVRYTELTDEKIMRHPSFLGLRVDKNPEEVKDDKVIKAPRPHKIPNKKLSGDTEKVLVKGVEVSNSSKIFWPKQKITKGDVIRYYEEIAEFILPHLKDRPQSLYRTPDGYRSKGFFQKNMAGKVPSWIPTVVLDSGSGDKKIEYMLCQEPAHLIYMVNLGCIEINPWSSGIQSPDHPDYAIFDLDPVAVSFSKVIQVALEIRRLLDSLEVESFCKTSGSDGFHIYVPLGAGYTYDQSLQFVKIVESRIHNKIPEITSMERMPSKRKKKVYLDFLQNGRGKTMASPYSLRPREIPAISTPLRWEEVNPKLDPGSFNIRTVLKRLEKHGDLWENLYHSPIDMHRALELLSGQP